MVEKNDTCNDINNDAPQPNPFFQEKNQMDSSSSNYLTTNQL